MLIYDVYYVYSGFAEAQEKTKQNPLCINYNNPTSRERKKKEKIHAEIKAERPGVIMCQKIFKKKTTSLPTQVGKVCQTYSSFTLITRGLRKICFYPSSIMPLIVCPLGFSLSTYHTFVLISSRTMRRD